MNTYLVKVYGTDRERKTISKEYVFRCDSNDIRKYIDQELKILGKTISITDVTLFKKIEDINVNYSEFSFI